MRCEVLGSFNMPGVKKNISDLFELEISNIKKEKIKVSKEKTIKFLLRDFLLQEKMSLKYQENLDKDYKKIEKFLKNYKKDILSLINNQKKFGSFINDLLETIFLKTDNSSKKNDRDENEEENIGDKNEDSQQQEKLINEDFVSDDLIEKLDSDEFNKSENIEFSDDSDESNIEFISKPSSSSEKDTEFKYKIYTTKFDNIINASKLCDIGESSKLRKQLDKQTSKLDSTITILANKLQRKLLAKQKGGGNLIWKKEY